MANLPELGRGRGSRRIPAHDDLLRAIGMLPARERTLSRIAEQLDEDDPAKVESRLERAQADGLVKREASGLWKTTDEGKALNAR